MNLEENRIFNNCFDLYAFSGIISRETIDRGYMPWWSSRNSIGNFFRPVASLLLTLDYSLWRDYPVLVHMHSLIWFFILVILVYYVYRNINQSLVLAGFSCFLFILDDINTWPVLFIANRHIIISAVFSFASFLSYIRYSREKDGLFLLLSYAFFIVSILTSETGITVGAYFFSYSLFLDKNSVKKKIATLVPFVFIIIIWRFIYSISGYGVYNQMLYVDPINNPLQFISALVIRYPLYLCSVLFFPVAEILLLSAPSIHIFLSIAGLGVITLLFVIFSPFCKGSNLIFFWFTGILLSVIPACMGMPSSRLLTFTCTGVMGLSGLLLKDIIRPHVKRNASVFHNLSIRITVPLFLILYLFISPALIIMHYMNFQKGKEYRSNLVNFKKIPCLERKTIILIKPPNTSAFVAGLIERGFTHGPVPEFVRFLCSGLQTLEIHRTDLQSLVVKPQGGYNILPSEIIDPGTGKVTYFNDQLFYRWMETLYYNPELKWEKGDSIRLTGLTIKVKDVTGDGRILEALFVFKEPLESITYEWIIWDPVSSEYRSFSLMDIGEKITIP